MISRDELLPRLKLLNGAIDSMYVNTVSQTGFTCSGCDGVKCCTVDLILHTYVEMMYLRRGFSSLESKLKQRAADRASAMASLKSLDPWGDDYRNSVCALNLDGKCILYEHRPMICRLAGVRHLIRRPDGLTHESNGCHRFETEIRAFHPEAIIDRTPFYKDMAKIEIEMIRSVGKRAEPKTISEVLSLSQDDAIFV